MKHLLLGVTGGLATGKSTFAQMLAARARAQLFDADAAVHSLLATDPQVQREVRERIRPRAFLPDGSPDRPLLRELIFNNPRLRACIEEILHPRVRALWQRQARACQSQSIPLVAEIPLLYEAQAAGDFDAVIVVACSEAIRVRRLEARGVSHLAKKMIASQWPLDTKVQLAHHVVWNDGSIQSLAAQTDHLLRLLDVPSG
ncbi:MAG: dephospho-CoA kinase [Terrimicrobiaceae bacterium]|nr:dephospho-CoA kinase [Terrimicrobiaceae bacterium]